MQMVLLHGWGATGAVWRRQAEAFEGVCEVQAPAIGRWDTAWVAHFLGHISLPQAVLIGWSLGGMLLLEALTESRTQPMGLILVGVPAVFCQRQDHPWGQPPQAVRVMRRALKKDAPKVLRDFAGSCLAAGEEMFRGEVTDLFRPDMEATELAVGLDYLINADLRPRLARLPVKPVIVQGEADPIVPPEQARFLSEQLPGSRLVMLPGAGHAPFLTQAARFNEIVRKLMGEDRGNAVQRFGFSNPPNR